MPVIKMRMAMELVRSFEETARAGLPASVYDYYAGGAGDERTVADNELAWSKVWLRPRGLVDVSAVDPSVTLLGASLSLPVLLAPVAAQRLLHPDGEAAAARAAAAAGTVFCLSTSGSCTPQELAGAAPRGPRWFQLYVNRDRSVSEAALSSLEEAGFSHVVVTIDLAVGGRRERERRHFEDAARQIGGWDTSLSWDDLDWVAATSGLPLIVKGVLTEEDAREALARGAAAVIVSNHGGRQLDGAVPTAVALREVAQAVGERVPVLVDGGIRSGGDVVRALALGAKAALVGRPYAWALAADGEAGVRRLLAAFDEDVRITLALLGTPTPDQVDGRAVRLAGW